MKKKLMFLVLMLSLVLALSGCIRCKIGVTVKKNGKVDLNIFYAVSDSLGSFSQEGTTAGLSNEDLEKYKKEGYTVTPYAEDGYTGYTLSKSDMELSDLKDKDGTSENPLNEVTVKKEGNVYTLDIPNFIYQNQTDDTRSYMSMIAGMGGYVKMSITTPVKAVESNASAVSDDGKTLTWDLLAMAPEDSIHVKFKVSAFNPAWILLGAALLAVIAAVIIKSKRDRTEAAVQPADAAEPMPQAEKAAAQTDSAAVEEELRRFKKMLDDGLITEEDYKKKKDRLLGINS